MCEERDAGVAGGEDEGGAEGLFAEEVLVDVLLDGGHDGYAEVADDGSIDAGGHDAEGIAGGDEAVMRREVFEIAGMEADVRQAREAVAEGVNHEGIGMDEMKVKRRHGGSITPNGVRELWRGAGLRG
jgi:hypothetical protein